MSPKERKLGDVVRDLTLLEAGRQVNLSPSAVGRLARALGGGSRQLTELDG